MLQEKQKIIQAGKIASQVREYAKKIIKPGMLLLDIAEKIESEIEKLGAKPAFPVNLCINEVAAHFTPQYNDESIAKGLLKIDLGCHIDGYVADTAFSIDLENSEENKKLIQASEKALNQAIKLVEKNPITTISEIGSIVHKTITNLKFSPIRNLSGHEIKQYNLHAGLLIPNYDNGNKTKLTKSLYAIEPFSTSGTGIVKNGAGSNIYRLENKKPVRDKFDREVLKFIETFNGLPFCSRWIVKKFSSRAILSLLRLERQGILHHYKQLIEKSNKPVSQAEHTILIADKVIITTR